MKKSDWNYFLIGVFAMIILMCVMAACNPPKHIEKPGTVQNLRFGE